MIFSLQIAIEIIMSNKMFLCLTWLVYQIKTSSCAFILYFLVSMEGLNTGGINSHLNMNTKEDLSHYNSNLIRNDDKVPIPDSKLLLIGSDNQVLSKVKNTLYNKNDYISSSEICDSEDDNSRSSPSSCKKRRRLSDSSGSENSPAKPHKEEKRDYFEEVKEEESSSGSESSKVSCNYHDSSDAEQRVVMSAPAPSHPLSDSDEDLIVAVADTPSRKKGAVHTIKTIPKPRKPRNIKVKKSPPKSKSKHKRPVTDSSDSEDDLYYSSRRGRRKSRDVSVIISFFQSVAIARFF